MVTLPVPQDPTQNEETSFISIQRPENGTSLYHSTSSFTHHAWPLAESQSGKTV